MGSENGLVGLLQRPVRVNPDQDNIAAGGGGGGGTVRNSEICVSQPEGGTQTRPRVGELLDLATGPGLEAKFGLELPGPIRCAGTAGSMAGGGEVRTDEMNAGLAEMGQST